MLAVCCHRGPAGEPSQGHGALGHYRQCCIIVVTNPLQPGWTVWRVVSRNSTKATQILFCVTPWRQFSLQNATQWSNLKTLVHVQMLPSSLQASVLSFQPVVQSTNNIKLQLLRTHCDFGATGKKLENRCSFLCLLPPLNVSLWVRVQYEKHFQGLDQCKVTLWRSWILQSFFFVYVWFRWTQW